MSAIEVRAIVKRFGAFTAVNGVSFTVGQGEIFGLLGPNGGGKTTLFKIVSTLLFPTEGTVRVFGDDVVKDPAAVRRRLGVVFQHPALDGKLTVDENLRHQGHLYGLSGRSLTGRIGEVLAGVRLEDRRRDMVATLSGGLQRRAGAQGSVEVAALRGGVIDNAEVAFKYLRAHSDVIPIPGFESAEQVDEIVSIYSQPNVIDGQDVEMMENYRSELGKNFCRRCEYCQPCPQGVMITPAMGYPTVARRISPPVAVEFCRKAMESIPLCTECGNCIERCPYELQIPDILKANYALYEEHLKEKEG